MIDTTLTKVAATLNSEYSYDYGFSNKDAVIEGNKVRFTYPAPVISGACWGEVVVYEDGSIYDNTLEQSYDSYDEWAASMEIDEDL